MQDFHMPARIQTYSEGLVQHHVRPLISSAVITLAVCLWVAPLASADEPVAPVQMASVLAERCLLCHGPDKQEGGYRLDTAAKLRLAGDSGKEPVVPSDPKGSELLRRLTTTDKDERMPADAEPLTAEQIELVRQWIASGATLDSKLESSPLYTWGRPVMKKKSLEHYPAALPVTALALEPASSGDAEPDSVWTSGYGEILRWSLSDEAPLRPMRQTVSGVHVARIDVSSDGHWLAVSSGFAGSQGFVELMSLSHDSIDVVWSQNSADIPSDLAFSPDGQRLAIARQDGTLVIVNLQATLLQSTTIPTWHTYTPHADAILAVAWSAKGDRLITGSRDRTAKIFDTKSMELIANYDRHERAVGGVAYCGDTPVSLDETGKLRLWAGDDSDRTLAERDNQARFLEQLMGHEGQVWLAHGNHMRAFSVQRKTVEDGKDDEGKPKTKKVTRWEQAIELESPRSSWLLSSDLLKHHLAVGDESGEVLVWQLPADKETQPTLVKSFSAKP